MTPDAVIDRFKEFCSKNNFLTAADLGSCCAKEEMIKDEMLDATGIADLSFVERKNIKKAWVACRGRMTNVASAASAAPAQVVPMKMPEGAENRLRTLWKGLHGINLPGGWLATEPVMAQMFHGLHDSNKKLYVPDISTILRRSMLNQKPEKGTLITEHGVQQLDYTMSPCTTQPEFFLRIRSYVMTIAYIVVATPKFFTFETAIDLVDYIFEAINCRPDGRRPSLMQLHQCYLSMFGDYAKQLQNTGISLEEWLAFKGNWQHIWRDASAAEPVESAGAHGRNVLNIPDDLTNMVRMNQNFMKGMQSTIDKKLTSLQN